MTKIEQRVLNYINGLRKKLGKRPLKQMPKGTLNHASACPIAVALEGKNDSAYVHGRLITTGSFATNPPLYVRHWIAKFDRGCYPHLVK